MDDKDKSELLNAEYLRLQGVVEGFDAKALTVKAWSITFSLSAIGVAFATDDPAAARSLVVREESVWFGNGDCGVSLSHVDDFFILS